MASTDDLSLHLDYLRRPGPSLDLPPPLSCDRNYVSLGGLIMGADFRS